MQIAPETYKERRPLISLLNATGALAIDASGPQKHLRALNAKQRWHDLVESQVPLDPSFDHNTSHPLK